MSKELATATYTTAEMASDIRNSMAAIEAIIQGLEGQPSTLGPWTFDAPTTPDQIKDALADIRHHTEKIAKCTRNHGVTGPAY